MRQRAAASLLYQSQYAEPAFRNLLKSIFLKIVGRILAFYSRGQRVNDVYSHLFSGPKWYNLPESHKFSSIYCANSIPVKQRSFGDELDEQDRCICDTEHRRWVMSELLLGFKAYTNAERESYKAKVREEMQAGAKKVDSATWCELHKVLRPKTFFHIDIDAFESLVDEDERLKDVALMKNIPYILGETNIIQS